MALWDPRAVQTSFEMALADAGGRRTKQRRLVNQERRKVLMILI